MWYNYPIKTTRKLVTHLKKQSSGNFWSVFSWAIFLVLVLTEGTLLFWIGRLAMLPPLYFGILIGLCVLVTLVLGLMLLRRPKGRWLKKKSFGRQITAGILSILMIAGCLFGALAVSRLHGTISAITSVTKITVLLEVYVPASDPAQYIQDTAGYTYGIADTTEAEDAEKILTHLASLLHSPVEIIAYPNSFAMIDGLRAGEVDAIVLDSSYLSVLGSLEAYAGFANESKVLHEYMIEKIVPVAKPVEKEKSCFLVYISGNDARKALLADGGSDVNILAVVNPEAHQVLLVNTPRDYYVENPAGDGARDKLSHCGLNGIQNCIEAMERLYGCEIDYYARINFTGFKTLVDAVGGVTVHSDIAFKAGDYYINKGENHLNGSQALAFARERKALAGGDNDRGKNQMKLISALIAQLSASTLLANYAQILEGLEGMFTTSIPAATISRLVQNQLKDMSGWDVLTFAVTGDNGNDTCWAVGGGYGYVMYPHEHMVAQASDLIARALKGEVLTQEDLAVGG